MVTNQLTFDFILQLHDYDLMLETDRGLGDPELRANCRILLSIGIDPSLKGEQIMQATFWVTSWLFRVEHYVKLDFSKFNANRPVDNFADTDSYTPGY